MGGCVSSVMDRVNAYSMEPHSNINSFRNYGPHSVAMPNTETATCSATYRNGHHYAEKEFTKVQRQFYNGANQVHRFRDLCEARTNAVAFTYRLVSRVVKEKVRVGDAEKVMDISYVGDRKTMTCGDLWDRMVAFGRGLVELGLTPRSNVAIYEETRWEWLATIYGIWTQDMVAATVYANLGEDALYYALRETESKAIICNGRGVPNLLRGIASGAFPACTIIYLDDLPDGLSEEHHGARLVSWMEVVHLGKGPGAENAISIPTDNDTIALIMYTSGTTGDPKGVIHSHGSITSGIQIMDHWLYSLISPIADETYIAYLPLAHILEFGVVNIMLARGALVAFGNPRTLTDVTARPRGDLTEFRPTLLIGVPRIFDTLRRAVEAKLPPEGTLKRQVFNNAYHARLTALRKGMETPYYNDKIFSLPRAAVGGRVRLFLSGGGPLSGSTQEFINVVFGLMVVGWGLTETICVGAIQRLGDLEAGCTGQVLIAEELKVTDTEEYKHTDTPEPRGEICLRGPFMFKGYYKQPELTKEVLDEEGWFRTGDVGSIDKDGKLRIIGRVKALAKNVLGEYIALETLESIYATNPLVVNSCVCVLVHPERNYIVAIALTDSSKALKFAKEHDISGSYPAILSDPKFRKCVDASMAATARDAKRKPFECVKHAVVLDEEWTPENGVLTAAMKLKRRVVNDRYEAVIRELFAQE